MILILNTDTFLCSHPHTHSPLNFQTIMLMQIVIVMQMIMIRIRMGSGAYFWVIDAAKPTLPQQDKVWVFNYNLK